VAVISGGTRGLGRTLVERLLADGWCVATFSRHADDLTAAMAREAPDRFLWAEVDLADAVAVRRFVNGEIVPRFGRIDLLVNNAAVLHHGPFLTTPAPRMADMVATNLIGPMVLTQTCARAMVRQRGGVIVNVSSVNAVRGYRGVAAYAATKAGLDSFTRCLARELGSENVRVNSVVPGFLETELTATVTDRNRDRIRQRTPLQRVARCDEVADAILFVASEAASFITGQTLVVDGGITC